jgi:outer membrane protein assembly factor BamB
MAIGYITDSVERDKFWDDLAFTCYGEYNPSKASVYRERIIRNHSNEEDKSEEDTITIESIPSASSDLIESSWPMYCHDIKRTGQSPYGAVGNFGIEKWKYLLDGLITSSPAIDENGTVYVGGGTTDESLFAFYPNGTKKWSFKTDGHVQSSPAIADDGTIFVGSNDAGLYAIYPNGTEKWRVGLGNGWVKSSPVIDEKGIVYAASVGSGRLCAVYPNNGTIKWDFYADDWIYCSPALDDDGNVYIGSNDGYLYALYSNGTLKWKYYAGGSKGIGSAPTIGDDGTVYFGATSGYLYALYQNGTLKWKVYTDYIGGSSPAISNNGTIYVGSNNGNIYSVDSNGTIKWSFYTGEDISASPAIDRNEIIYIGSWNDQFYAFNPNGTVRWKFNTDNSIHSSSAIAEDGTIYVGSWDGYFYALNVIDNSPPNNPIIDGSTEGEAGVEYDYTFVSTDPNGDNLSYLIEWGDGIEIAIGPYLSGEEAMASHSWERGTYTIRAKAVDSFGAESNWSELEVTMPRGKTVHVLIERLLERFPLLEQLLLLLKLIK